MQVVARILLSATVGVVVVVVVASFSLVILVWMKSCYYYYESYPNTMLRYIDVMHSFLDRV